LYFFLKADVNALRHGTIVKATPRFGSERVCAGVYHRCHLVHWGMIEDVCSSVGGRLCSLAEIQNDEARMDACHNHGHNASGELIWTSTQVFVLSYVL
jgi:hypothetical protein